MDNPVKFGDRCYVMPHKDVCFCFVFPSASDAEIFELGVCVYDKFRAVDSRHSRTT